MEETIFKELLSNGAMGAVLFYFLRTVWNKMQEKDKALIDFLQATNQQNLAAQQRQIESDERTRGVLSDLKGTMDGTNKLLMNELTEIKAQINRPTNKVNFRKNGSKVVTGVEKGE